MTMTDTDETGKLFVGGLSWETSTEVLKGYFSQYGEVTDCVVMKNNETGRSRGFGFVTYKDPQCISLVLANKPHEINGRMVDPKECTPRSMQRGRRTESQTKIFLGGLPTDVTETDIRQAFSKFGKVASIIIMYDQEKKKSRGFGFLSFESEDSIDQVCAEHYVSLNGKQIECKRAEPRENSRKNQAFQNANRNQSWRGSNDNQSNWNASMPSAQSAGGYQAGWNSNAMQQPYNAQGGYQAWGSTPAAANYSYNSAPYSQYGAASSSYQQGYNYADPAASSNSAAPAAAPAAYSNSYGDVASNYGPTKSYGGYQQNSQTSSDGNASAGYGAQGDSQTRSQGYHPYRR